MHPPSPCEGRPFSLTVTAGPARIVQAFYT